MDKYLLKLSITMRLEDTTCSVVRQWAVPKGLLEIKYMYFPNPFYCCGDTKPALNECPCYVSGGKICTEYDTNVSPIAESASPFYCWVDAMGMMNSVKPHPFPFQVSSWGCSPEPLWFWCQRRNQYRIQPLTPPSPQSACME